MENRNDHLHPKFIEAMEQLKKIPREQWKSSEEARQWRDQTMAYAPEYLQKEMDQKARELGLIPEPQFYTENGQPVFTAEQIAAHLGLPVEQVIADAERFQAEFGDHLVAVDPAKLHRKN